MAMPMLAPTSTCRPDSVSGAWRVGQQALADGAGIGHVGDIEQEDAELIAAETGGDVARPQARSEALGDDDEQLVAGGVAEAVVDGLEVVEVEEHRRDRAGAGPRGEGRLGLLDEAASVDEAGQGIVEGLVAELNLQGASLVDVALEQPDEAGQAGQHEEGREARSRRPRREPAGRVGAHRDEERPGDHREREADHPDRS